MRKGPAGRALRARTASYFSAVHFHAWFQCHTTHTVEGCRPGHHSLWFCPSKYLVSGSGWESLQTSCFSGFLTVVKVVMCLLKNPTLRYRTKVFGGEDLFLSFDFGIHELHLCGRVLPVRCGVSPKAPRHSWEVVPRGEMSEHWACPGRGHWDPALPFSSPLCFPADCQGTICSIRCSCQEVLPQNISRGKAAKRPRTESSEAITGSITFFLYKLIKSAILLTNGS